MSYSEFQKSQKKHVRCVICGHGFQSEYNPDMRSFPVYHPDDDGSSCESRFYKALLHIYVFIHRTRASISMSALMSKFDWRVSVLMKKEYINWCMSRGFLDTDNLQRLLPPEEVSSACKELFENLDMNDEEEIEKAVLMLKSAMEIMAGELANKHQDMAQKAAELTQQKPQSDPHKIPVVDKKKSSAGMATAERTGAKQFGKRFHSARGDMQRQKAI